MDASWALQGTAMHSQCRNVICNVRIVEHGERSSCTREYRMLNQNAQQSNENMFTEVHDIQKRVVTVRSLKEEDEKGTMHSPLFNMAWRCSSKALFGIEGRAHLLEEVSAAIEFEVTSSPSQPRPVRSEMRKVRNNTRELHTFFSKSR